MYYRYLIIGTKYLIIIIKFNNIGIKGFRINCKE